MKAVYSITIKRSAEKELRALPKADLQKVIKKIQALAGNPRPVGHQKLSGETPYRFRQGDYRILYTVDDKGRIVDIVKIGHRKEVYKKL